MLSNLVCTSCVYSPNKYPNDFNVWNFVQLLRNAGKVEFDRFGYLNKFAPLNFSPYMREFPKTGNKSLKDIFQSRISEIYTKANETDSDIIV